MFFALWNIYKDDQNQELGFKYLVSANKLNRKTIDYSTNESKKKKFKLNKSRLFSIKESSINTSPNIIFIIDAKVRNFIN